MQKENLCFTTGIKFKWKKPKEDGEMKDVARLQMMFRLSNSLLSLLSNAHKSSLLLEPVLTAHEESQRTKTANHNEALVLFQMEEGKEEEGWITICYRQKLNKTKNQI